MEDNYQAEQTTESTESTTVDNMADLTAIMESKESGTAPTLPSQEEESTESDTTETSTDESSTDSENENEGTTEETEGTTDVLTTEKANAAFAEMRKKNATMQATLETLAANLGLASVEDLQKKAQEDALNNKAKAQNLDPAVLKRMEDMESQLKLAKQQERETGVLMGLKRAQSEFNLSDDAVKVFAKEMVDNNIDIMSNTVDPTIIYRGLHHQELIDNAVKAAEQEWIKHNNKSENASTPGTSRGTGAGTTDSKKITSMSQLNDILRDIKK